MPWTTPTLRSMREIVRGEVTASLQGASFVGNSVLRVMADAMAAVSHLVMKYIDWLSRQLMPDTSETEWLDRHGNIWLTNADGTFGRKTAGIARGSVYVTGTLGAVVPAGTQLVMGDIRYETIEMIGLTSSPTPVGVDAIDPGTIGNREPGDVMSIETALLNVDSEVTVVTLSGGTDTETDDELRVRVLQRIRNPPMGGSQADYITWGMAVPGVTRVWAAQEMGMGTVTVRFMCDDLRAENDGFPLEQDIRTVDGYINTKRPVAVKDYFIVAPVRYPVTVTVRNMSVDTEATRAAIVQSVDDVFHERAEPGGTFYAAWVSEAISATNLRFFDLDFEDVIVPSPGHLAMLDSINFDAD